MRGGAACAALRLGAVGVVLGARASAAVAQSARPPSGIPEPLSCMVDPSRRVLLSTAVPGIARRVLFERGDMVQAGATLLELHGDVERAQLALANERVQFARRRLARNREVISRNLVSAHEADELRTELRLAELEANRAQAELERRTIASPFTGIVHDRRVSVGEYVAVEPFAELIALDPLYVELVLRAEAFGLLREGMELSLQLLAPVHAGRTARIALLDRAIDAGSGTFRVRAVLANPDIALPSGINCRLVGITQTAG
jgi:RND family efflux transporter MFP subunit